jgi:hypothetical protein
MLVAQLIEGLSRTQVEVLSPREQDARSTLVFFSHRAKASTAGSDVYPRHGECGAAPHLYNTSTDIDDLSSAIA